ncbi:MAG TPA: hypothetical protein VHZ76_03320 [Gammaproteobacteria bacterium]|nr:hypothetical protein [Gammaproteobacteria bacterium]
MNQMYTHEQLEIELLKNNQNHTFKVLERLESKLDESLNRLESKMNSQHHWILGAIFGLYGIGVTALIAVVCKAYSLI